MPNTMFHLQFPTPPEFTKITLKSFFESLDGWEPTQGGSGTYLLDGEKVMLTTNLTVGSYASIVQRFIYTPFDLTWDKARSFKLKALVGMGNDNTPQCHMITGNYSGSNRSFGFKFYKDKIQGHSADGSNIRTVDLETGKTPPWATTKTYEAILTPATKIEFYIDGVLVGTITDRIPTGTTDAGRLIHIQVVNSVAVNHYIHTGYVEVFQDS